MEESVVLVEPVDPQAELSDESDPSLLGASTDSAVLVDSPDTKNESGASGEFDESDDEDAEAALTTRPDNTLSVSLQALLSALDDDDDEEEEPLPADLSTVSSGPLPVEELDL
jgi:hypothetical protein